MTVKLRFAIAPSRLRRIRRLVAPFAVAVALAPSAHAQSQSDVDTARAAFLQGLELRDKQHDPAGAVAKLKAAYALVPTPRIGFELGRTMRATGDLVGARAAFVAATQLPPRAMESAEAKQARVDAQTQADDLERRIPQIQLHLNGFGQIFVDGEAVRHDALSVPRHVNPGSHVIQVQVEGDVKGEQTVVVAEGEHKDVTMSPGAQARVTVTAQATLPQVQVVQPEPQPYQPYDPFATPVTNRVKSNAGTKAGLYYAALTLGGVGVLPGLVALGYMKGAQDACSNGVCTSDADSKKTLAYAFAIGTDVIWGAAIICFITAIAYPSTSALDLHTQVGFSPAPGGGMLSATGRF
jgi:hypothetical protein